MVHIRSFSNILVEKYCNNFYINLYGNSKILKIKNVGISCLFFCTFDQMKWLSYILAFWVVFLTVHPAIALASSSADSECCGSCCGNENDSQKKDTPINKDCSNQSCNPFQACGCCMGFVLKTAFLKMEQPIVQRSMLIIFKENSISQFSPDVWQPPKIS